MLEMFENFLPSQLENISSFLYLEHCRAGSEGVKKPVKVCIDITLVLGIIICVKMTLEWARWVPHRLAFLNSNVTVSM